MPFTALGEHYGWRLRRCSRTALPSSTVPRLATNAIINRNTAKISLILTKGHRDMLTLREVEKKKISIPGSIIPNPLFRAI